MDRLCLQSYGKWLNYNWNETGCKRKARTRNCLPKLFSYKPGEMTNAQANAKWIVSPKVEGKMVTLWVLSCVPYLTHSKWIWIDVRMRWFTTRLSRCPEMNAKWRCSERTGQWMSNEWTGKWLSNTFDVVCICIWYSRGVTHTGNIHIYSTMNVSWCLSHLSGFSSHSSGASFARDLVSCLCSLILRSSIAVWSYWLGLFGSGNVGGLLGMKRRLETDTGLGHETVAIKGIVSFLPSQKK